ncbi:MAG: hypothetical protein H7Z75_04365 [Ferruginibacter sp.]|nr:hypothetical protein [Cytophagales bacterium]
MFWFGVADFPTGLASEAFVVWQLPFVSVVVGFDCGKFASVFLTRKYNYLTSRHRPFSPQAGI